MKKIDYNIYKEESISGRYITINKIEKLTDNLKLDKEIIGYSYLNKPIYKIKLGNGKIKVLIWSQMHGNESTGTKAIFDLLNFFTKPKDSIELRNSILNNIELIIIPILNPDGATLYTRENAQNIDLNRDAVDLSTPESKVLNKILYKIKPKYCFNLHDQRPIFSVGEANLPATISFLAPSEDKERTITTGRKETMRVIVSMNNELQKYIPNQVGRYSDEFYPTATGDNFQKAGFNTILIEAGHYPNDYVREITRKYNFIALLKGISYISKNINIDFKDYFKIPNNDKKYYEFILTNVIFDNNKKQVGVFFKDVFIDEKIVFIKDFNILDDNIKYNANKYISKKLIFSKEKDIFAFIKDLT